MSDVGTFLQHGRLGEITLGASASDVERSGGPPAMRSEPRPKHTIWSFGAVQATFDAAGSVMMLAVYPSRSGCPPALRFLRDSRAELSSRARIIALCKQLAIPLREFPELTFDDQFGLKAGTHVTIVGTTSNGQVEKLIVD